MRPKIDAGFKQHAGSKSQLILLKHNGPVSTGMEKDGEKDLAAFMVHYCEYDILALLTKKLRAKGAKACC